MPPPKKMTANPIRPARHRAGKPGAAPVDSSSDEDSEDEEPREPQTQSKPATAPPPAASFPKKSSQISSGLKKVDISGERIKPERKVQFANESESEEEDSKESDGSDEESGSEEESSSEEASSSEDEAARRKLLRPVFIKKNAR